MLKKIWFLIIVATLFISAGLACSASKKGSGIEGKVVDVNNKPLAEIKITATWLNQGLGGRSPLKGYEKFEVKTKSDGSFTFKGLYPEVRYEIAPQADDYINESGATVVETAPAGEIEMLQASFVLRFSPIKISQEGILTDTRTGLEWVPPQNQSMNWFQADSYARGLSLSGGSWRLPTRAELRNISEELSVLCQYKSICTGGQWWWTSEENGPDAAWGMTGNMERSFSRARGGGFDNARVFVVRSRR